MQVTCREEEQAEIRDFLVKTLIDKGSSNCLCIFVFMFRHCWGSWSGEDNYYDEDFGGFLL